LQRHGALATAVTLQENLGIHLGAGLTANETSDAIGGNGAVALSGVVACTDGGGSGFNGGTVAIQGSIDKVNWFTLKDVQGNDITFSDDGAAEFASGFLFFRASADASISNVDLTWKVR